MKIDPGERRAHSRSPARREGRFSRFFGGRFGLLLLAGGWGCSPLGHPSLPLTAYVPPDADAILYADLDRLRTTPLRRKLPMAGPLAAAAAVMAIAKEGEWAVAGQGRFRQPPEGATMLGPDVGAVGAPALLQAMTRKPGGASGLLAQAPRQTPVWLVALGRATLPVTGNLGNLNRLLHQAELTTIAVRIANLLEIDATARGATDQKAQHLEQNLRALGSLARLPAFRVTRDGTTVRVTAALPLASLPEWR